MNKDNTYFLDGYRVRVKELEDKIEAEKARKKEKRLNNKFKGKDKDIMMKVPKYQTDKNLATAVYLREQIKCRCLSYRKLATITGVNYNVISCIANGELPTLDSWQQVCTAFTVPKIEVLEVYEQAVKESLVIKVAKEKERYNKVKEKIEKKEHIINRGEENENSSEQ